MNYILKKSTYGKYVLIIYKDNAISDISNNYDRDYEDESAQRSKRTVLDIALNNDFDWFVTFTFHTKGRLVEDRKDFQAIKKKFLIAIQNYNRDYNTEIKYVAVPELHKNKMGIHFHCLMSGLNTERDFKFAGFDKKKGYPIFVSKKFKELFGANRGIRIKDYNEFVAFYTSKYITKTDDRIFYRRYFRSLNLNRSEVLARGSIANVHNLIPSFENGLLSIYQLDTIEGLEYLLN